MFRMVARRVIRGLTLVRFGLLILRWCGPRIFISKTMHQIYGQTVFLVTKKPSEKSQITSDFKCTVKLATPDDIKELFKGLHAENPEGRYQLLVRQWYHERGLGDCYISRAMDTNEICVVRWVVTSSHIRQMGWEDRFPLEDDEYMGENVYTFEKYRRLGAAAVSSDLTREIMRQRGFKYTRYYVDETNIPSLKWGEKAGDKICERILERHFLFRVTRKTLQKYDPPVPFTEILEKK